MCRLYVFLFHYSIEVVCFVCAQRRDVRECSSRALRGSACLAVQRCYCEDRCSEVRWAARGAKAMVRGESRLSRGLRARRFSCEPRGAGCNSRSQAAGRDLPTAWLVMVCVCLSARRRGVSRGAAAKGAQMIDQQCSDDSACCVCWCKGRQSGSGM